MSGTTMREAGFSYFEVLLASVILAGAVTCMGLALEQSATITAAAPVTATGNYLLQDGIAWARSLRRVDVAGPGPLGMETGELVVADIDDVDDLNGLVETGPIDRAGAAYPTTWVRSWTVASANLTDAALTATPGSTPLLRLHVTVTFRGAEVAADTILLARTP